MADTIIPSSALVRPEELAKAATIKQREGVTEPATTKKVSAPSKPACLPEAGFVRLKDILSVYPVGRSTWWAGVKSGRYPPPVKLGPRITAWRVELIRALIEKAR